MDAKPIQFGDYKVHPTQGLSREGLCVHVTPKSLSLLWELVQHPMEVVTKDEIFSLVWPNSVVTDAALSCCIRELRQTLRDDARDPHFIETVHRVGFRFLHECTPDNNAEGIRQGHTATNTRDNDLKVLLQVCARAERGQSQLVLIEGAAAATISALVGRLLNSIGESGRSWVIGVGSASSIGGRIAAYQPVLQSMQSLCKKPGGMRCIAALRRHAPTCLAELTDLVDVDELENLRKGTAGITTQRWHEELYEFFTTVTDSQPLLLVLENIQWADEYTIEWLQDVLKRYELPIMIAIIRTRANAQQKRRQRVAWAELLAHRRTQRIEVLPMNYTPFTSDGKTEFSDAELEVLEQVATVGYPCHAGLLAAGVEIAVADAESMLSSLAERGALYYDLALANDNNGNSDTLAMYLRTEHSPTREGPHRLPLSRRNRIHRRVARYLKSEARDELAPLIAAHYDRGLEPTEAMHWLLQTAAVNTRRGAYRLAQENLELGRARLTMLSGQDRLEYEARLALAAARVAVALRGIGSPEAEHLYTQVRQLQRQLQSLELRFDILWELWVHVFNRGTLEDAGNIVDELSRLAKQMGSPELDLAVLHARWAISHMLGDLTAVQHCTQLGMEACGNASFPGLAITRGCTPADAHLANHHAAVCAGFFRSWADALKGKIEEAKLGLHAAVTHARDIGHPYSLDLTLVMSAASLAAAGEAEATRRYAKEAHSLALEHGFSVISAWAAVYLGWAEASLGKVDEGLTAMREGLALCSGTPHCLFRPFQLVLYCEVLVSNGLYSEAVDALDEAFETAERTGDRLAWSEMHRLRGELAVARSSARHARIQARQDIQIALDFATEQQAELLVARARGSLARLPL